MTPAEEATFGSRCENCWTRRGVGVDISDAVEQVRRMLSPDEWEVECRLAAGQTYAEVALDRGLSPDTLKVRAGRWRARIRRKLPVY